MMNEHLRQQAEHLANRPYSLSIERDTLSDGREVIVLRHPELPGCKAQGFSLPEAKAYLDDARVDYIQALVELDLPVPAPAASGETTTHISEAI